MNFTIEQLLNAEAVLSKLSQAQFTGKKAFIIARLLKKLQAEEELYNEQRVTLIKNYADKDVNGEIVIDENNNVHISDGKLEEFNREFSELLNTEITISAAPICIDWLDSIELTPAEVQGIEPFIIE